MEANNAVPPLVQLRRLLKGQGLETQAQDTRDLVLTNGFDGWAVWIEGISPANWPEWRTFLSEFEAASRARPEIVRSVLVLILRSPNEGSLPANEVALQSLSWRGRVGEFDILLHCADRLEGSRQKHSRRRLLAHCAARVALWDLDLADRLLAERPERVIEPWDVLRSIARERLWQNGTPCTWRDGTMQEFDGIEETHSVYLVGIGDTTKVRRRLWSAQAAVLLPLLEERRQALIPRTSRYLSPPFQTVTGEAIADLAELEIGQICYFLHRDGADHGLKRTFRFLRDVRNALAHLEPISAQEALSDEILT